MKRSFIGPKTYAEALTRKQAKQAIVAVGLPSKSTAERSSERHSSNKHPSQAAFQGRIRSKARRAIKDKQLAEFRAIVRERDNYTCQWPGCGYQDRLISVQHIAKRSQRPDLIYDPSNGVALCNVHHNLADNTVQGRKFAKQHGLAGGETYELAKKENHA